MEFYDPEDAADQLRERSEHITESLDVAFELGLDEYDSDGDMDACAARQFNHPRMIEAYCDGWKAAAADEEMLLNTLKASTLE